MDIGTVEYKLVDFYAVERFSDIKFNAKPHDVDTPEMNGHCVRSAERIDDALIGANAKKALDFLVEHNGVYVKPYSKVHAVSAKYHAKDNSSYTKLGFNLPFAIEIPFEKYVELGKLETLSISLDVMKND